MESKQFPFIYFFKELWKQNWKGYIMASIVFTIGAVIIYAKQNPVFNINEFIIWLPLPLILLFIMVTAMGYFLFYGREE